MAGFVTNTVLGIVINISTLTDALSSNALSILRIIHRYTGKIFFILAFANIIGGW